MTQTPKAMRCRRCGRNFPSVQSLRIHSGKMHHIVPSAIEGQWFKKNFGWPKGRV